MDDKRRLVPKEERRKKKIQSTKQSKSHVKGSPPTNDQFDTVNISKDTGHETENSEASSAEAALPQLMTPSTNAEETTASLGLFSPLKLLQTSNSTVPSAEYSVLQNHQQLAATNPTINSISSADSPAEAHVAALSSPESEDENALDHLNESNNLAFAEKPTSDRQSHEQLRKTQNVPDFNSDKEYQRNNTQDKLNDHLSVTKITTSRDLVISPNVQNQVSLTNSGSKPPTAVASSNPRAYQTIEKEQPASERSRLFTPSTMEFGGYSSSGKNGSAVQDKAQVEDKTPIFVYYLACFATIGGLLFGYDTGIVSGSMLLIKDYFELSTMWQEVIVSGTVGAAAVFSLFAGFMCDFFGRKMTIMAASVVFVGGAIIMGAAESTGVLLAGRIVVGIGIGFASMTVPVYVAEAAPSSIRGRLVTLNQLFITIGILISSLVAGAFSSMKKTGWRYMLGLAGVPGVIQFIGFLFLPESPRWLVMKGKDEQASKVLQRIRGKEDVQHEINEIKEAVEEDKKQEGFVLGRVIRTQHVRRALFVGCGLQVFQQLCGINTVIYYSATILKMAGFPSEDAIWLVLVPNGINFLSTFIGVALVERLGRKKLIVGSFLGVVIALVVLAVGFQLSANFSPSTSRNVTEIFPNGSTLVDGCFEKSYTNCEKCIEDSDCGFCFSGDGNDGSCLKVQKHDEDSLSVYGRCQNETLKSALNVKFSHGYCPTDYTWMAVLGLALFVMAFAPGLGPMPWTINSEIYPMWARSTCTSLATGANWICNLVVSLFFLTLTETITKYGAFWLFGGICFLGMLFTIAFLPETKNKSLEEVEQLFRTDKKAFADNLGYERDISPPAVNSNTKL